MGKLFKKTVAIALVLMMVLTSGVFAFAADAETATVEAKDSLLMTLDELMAMDGAPAAPAQKPAVMLNGAYVDFPDAVPANVNGRIMVPFRAILEALGATVNYDTKTKEISAVLGDKAIYFYAGKPDIKVIEGGVESTVTMDVVPFIDAYTQRTYVPTRFMAEAFGLTVGWDSAEKTAVIIDFESMIPEITAKFAVIGMLFDTSDFDWSKNYKTTGSFDIDAALAAKAMQDLTGLASAAKANLSLDMDVAGIQKGLNADLAVDVKADISDFYELIGIEGTPNEAYVEEMLAGLDMKIKLDDENIYINMPALAYVAGAANETEAANTWYQVPMNYVYDTYAEMGIDFEAILKQMAQPMTLDEYIAMLADALENSMTIDTYYTVCAAVVALEECIGDDEFTKSGNTYKLSIDGDWIADKMDELGIPEDVIGDFVADMNDIGIDFSTQLTITATSAGKLSKYTWTGTLDIGKLVGINGTKLTLDASGNVFNTSVKCVVDVPDVVKVTVSTTENVTETSQSPNVKVPAGATVRNILDLM